MLSGVAADEEARHLAGRFTDGELVRMMTELQNTLAGFTRSSSRRLDAELCLIRLCQPELTLDAEALNARLTRLEERLNAGDFSQPPAAKMPARAAVHEQEDSPPPPEDADAPPEETFPVAEEEIPVGFWAEVCAGVRRELRPPVSAFFSPSPDSPVQGTLQSGKLVLECANAFTLEMVNHPEVLSAVARKAAALLGRQVPVAAVNRTEKLKSNPNLDRLLQFGREHGEIISIKE